MIAATMTVIEMTEPMTAVTTATTTVTAAMMTVIEMTEPMIAVMIVTTTVTAAMMTAVMAAIATVTRIKTERNVARSVRTRKCRHAGTS